MENEEFTQIIIILLPRKMSENICFIISISLHYFYMAVIGLLSTQFAIFHFLFNNNEPSVGRMSKEMATKEALGTKRLLQSSKLWQWTGADSST